MPSISKMAATSLALTTVLFMPGAFGAAIQSEGLERCDFDSESTLSPSPASDAAKRQSNADLDTALESIFGRPSADGDQKPSQDSLESIFGKPPAGSEQQTSLDILGSVSGKPPAGDDEQELGPEYLESIFGKPPPTPQGADANVPESNGQTPAPNDDGRVLSVGVYMHIVGKPGNNESVEFFLSRGDLDKQIDAMNRYYTPANISFHLLDADWTEDILLSSSRGLRTPLAHSLHKGTVADLNMFWVKPNSLRYGGTSKTFFAGGEDIKSDGVIIGTNTIPGGSHPVMNMGVTGVHEAGHWLGLQHTGFTLPGDCEPNWLNNPGQGNEPCGHRCDANFMSYGADACLTEFTPQQIETMRDVAINKRGL